MTTQSKSAPLREFPITPFDKADFGTIRTVAIEGEPWFVAADVARILGYRDAHTITRILDDDEKGTHLVCTPGGYQTMTIISESGLFAAIIRSDKPNAREFRKWVTSPKSSPPYDARAITPYPAPPLASCHRIYSGNSCTESPPAWGVPCGPCWESKRG